MPASHKRVQRPLKIPKYAAALATLEATGEWRLGRSGRLPKEVLEEKRAILERRKQRDSMPLRAFLGKKTSTDSARTFCGTEGAERTVAGRSGSQSNNTISTGSKQGSEGIEGSDAEGHPQHQ
ncbi:hypothetical protein FOZ63_018545, partial [Perkinsus olseni]